MEFTIHRNGLYFSVDYYVELLGVLCILCPNQDAIHEAGLVQCNEAYVQEVRDCFGSCHTDKLTQMLERFSKEYYFNYDAPVQLMLMLSNDEPIDRDALFRDREVIPEPLFDEFLEELKIFEQRSRFSEFFASHVSMYETIIERFAKDYAQYNSHHYLLSFLKVKPEYEYHINFMVGITNANYGATIGNKVYCNICPYDKTRYAPMPDYSYHPIYYSTLVLHEFAHSFVNHAVAKYSNKIEELDSRPYETVLDACGYGSSLETLINETIIRALECLYVKKNFPHFYDRYVAEYVEEGYFKIPQVVENINHGLDYERIIALFGQTD